MKVKQTPAKRGNYEKVVNEKRAKFGGKEEETSFLKAD